MGLLQKHPISACTRPVLRGAVSLAAADAGVASASAGRQSGSAASSSSHYHWQQQSGPSSRSTGPRPLSRFADPGLPGGRGGPPYPGRFSRSLSASRLGGGDGGWSPMANGRLANGHAEAAGVQLPGPPPGGAPFGGGTQASPMQRQGSREATPPPFQPAST